MVVMYVVLFYGMIVILYVYFCTYSNIIVFIVFIDVLMLVVNQL